MNTNNKGLTWLAHRVMACALASLGALAHADGAKPPIDPLASNNGFYPKASDWPLPYRTVNLAYPQQAATGWLRKAPRVRLTPANAPAYMAALKQHVTASLRGMYERPHHWQPADHGWYDMPWMAAAADASGGREPILASFTGQVLPMRTFADSGLTTDIQNHTVIYYDATAATMLRKLWANPFKPDRTAVSFPEGSIIVKAGAVSATPAQWPVLEGTATWTVFRPPVQPVSTSQTGATPPGAPQLTPLRALQFDIIVKDSVASPQTGWVFMTYIHDRRAPGQAPWDKLVPLGAQWGNDPQWARQPDGKDPKGGALTESWVNPMAPVYSRATLGWGGRLSGPIDVSERHNVFLTNGQQLTSTSASSCMSCHGTAQSPFLSNLYPSPNRAFPPDGTQFQLFVPGSREWARWFQNRPGHQPQDAYKGSVGLDYDMLIMFALAEVDAATDNASHAFRRHKVH